MCEQKNVSVVELSNAHRQKSYSNWPGIMIENKKQKTCQPTDVAISTDRNVVQKEAEKELEYKRLWTEIKRMWNLKCKNIPVVIRASRIVTKVLRKNLEAIARKRSIDSIQKTAMLGTSHNMESTSV